MKKTVSILIVFILIFVSSVFVDAAEASGMIQMLEVFGFGSDTFATSSLTGNYFYEEPSYRIENRKGSYVLFDEDKQVKCIDRFLRLSQLMNQNNY